MSKSRYVYIAQTKTGKYYTGIKTEPNKRIDKHNSGIGARLALEDGPFKLVYISQSFESKSQARKREIQIKGWTRKKKQKLINGEWE